MTVLPGYDEFANWDKGYGKLGVPADMATLRMMIPWIERTVLVVCDLVDVDGGDPIEVSASVRSCAARISTPHARGSM